MNRGVLYKASGQEYIEEVSRSAESVKFHSPGLKTALVTDDSPTAVDHVDRIVATDTLPSDYSSSILSSNQTPFDETIYLDSDTRVIDDITQMYDLLTRYELGITLTPAHIETPGLSEPYRQFNTGVYVFKNSKAVNNLFDRWKNEYRRLRETEDIINDQPAFSLALHDSDIRYATLPREYNAFVMGVGQLGTEAKILHGRPQDKLDEVGGKVNTIEIRSDPVKNIRVYRTRETLFGGRKVYVHRLGEQILPVAIYNSIRQDGVWGTAVKAIRKFSF